MNDTITRSSNPNKLVTASSAASSLGFWPEEVVKQAKASSRNISAIVDAVYGYLQAVRALGRDSVTAQEVTKALELNYADVVTAMEKLQSKGVKRI